MATVNEKMTAIADAIRDKTKGTEPPSLDDMATEIPEVYEAGQNSMVDDTKVIKQTVSGVGAIVIDDASPIPHDIKITVDSDSVTVRQHGKNIFNPTVETQTQNGVTCTKNDDNTYTVNGTATANCYFHVGSIPVIQGLTYYVSGGNADYSITWQLRTGETNTKTFSPTKTRSVFDVPENIDNLNCVISVKSGTTMENVIFKPMVSLFSNYDLEYEPYKMTEYTATNGELTVPSISPYMTLIADKGVTLTADYHKSWGMQVEQDRLWDALQLKGTRTDYGSLFSGSYWDNSSFKPKHDMKPSLAGAMFHSSMIRDLKSILEKQNVVLDFSQCTQIHHLFQISEISKVGVLDLTSNLRTDTIIGENYHLTDIDKIILKDDGSQPNGTFWGAFALKNVTFEGKIGQSCHFSQSANLTYESLMSIINALYDYSGTTETRTLTLHASAKARLNESDIAIAREKGWTIA